MALCDTLLYKRERSPAHAHKKRGCNAENTLCDRGLDTMTTGSLCEYTRGFNGGVYMYITLGKCPQYDEMNTQMGLYMGSCHIFFEPDGDRVVWKCEPEFTKRAL